MAPSNRGNHHGVSVCDNCPDNGSVHTRRSTSHYESTMLDSVIPPSDVHDLVEALDRVVQLAYNETPVHNFLSATIVSTTLGLDHLGHESTEPCNTYTTNGTYGLGLPG